MENPTVDSFARDAQSPQQQTAGEAGVYFESIDIQPEFRIPSPKQSLWTRCWQPIGTTVMDTGVLKEPRGFIRILQWFFAIIALATCVRFATYIEYEVTCKDSAAAGPQRIRHNVSYPFVPSAEDQVVSVTCGNITKAMGPPGDFSSDAHFFVFTCVVAFLSAMALLVVYVFMSAMYEAQDKKPPLYDFVFTVIMAVFWLSASAAWANGLTVLKPILQGEDWLLKDTDSICSKNAVYTRVVDKCEVVYTGSFGGAYASVILGFLNFFLWSSCLWFLYKETSWFVGRSQPQQMQET